MENIAVALVEPNYELNVGYVARVMKNFGVSLLFLVNSTADLSKAIVYASHGAQVLEGAQASDIKSLRKQFDLLIGTSAIVGSRQSNIPRNAVLAQDLQKHLRHFSGKICLLVGRDTTGLRVDELKLCDFITRIDTGTEYQTLNISHSLAILLHELRKLSFSDHRRMATGRQKELIVGYGLQMAELAGIKKYKIEILETTLRQLSGRGLPTHREATLLIGLMRKGVTALKKQIRYA